MQRKSDLFVGSYDFEWICFFLLWFKSPVEPNEYIKIKKTSTLSILKTDDRMCDSSTVFPINKTRYEYLRKQIDIRTIRDAFFSILEESLRIDRKHQPWLQAKIPKHWKRRMINGQSRIKMVCTSKIDVNFSSTTERVGLFCGNLFFDYIFFHLFEHHQISTECPCFYFGILASATRICMYHMNMK